ncbi:unnamed protein product [Adineta steineri]|uniref:Uncharacterized protein n=1 Tax=Adineta steineri TaxID=433720 RepID=A0A815AHF0_9BILA|nr:unnamed protein product [Adineta steineri]CAF1254659.1 unnamed protein product [Adineta steineri]CAF1287220.1 unnamed protein product [Adineta steineri]CAF1394844.1 unnamed protein product [Adineta steineri]CAF1457129.1 unnamed protein product [Adineta steineri]
MTNSNVVSITNQEYPIREPQNAQEFVNLIQNTICQIQDKFGQMSDSIMTKIDDMGKRIDDLERNIAHIISQTNAELP